MAHKNTYKKQGYKKQLVVTDKDYEKKHLPGRSEQTCGLSRFYKIWIVVIAFLGTAVYFQTFNYNFTQDDVAYSIENSATKRGLQGIPDIFTHGSLNYYNLQPSNSGTYRPVTLLTFCIESELFKGFNPKVGHAFNILLYFLVLLLVGSVLVKLFWFINVPLFIPLMILLLYALHPIHTEVVASIKSRDTLLSAFFLFGALYLWLTTIHRSGNTMKILTGILFFISLLSKEEGITFIAVVILISYFFCRMSFFLSWKEAIPFLMAALVYLVIRSIVLDKSTEIFDSVLNNVIYPLKGQQRFATNLFIYLYYIKLLIFPFPLSVDYSFGQITPKTFSNGWVVLSFLFFLFLIGSTFKNLSKRSVIRFGILYYLCTFSIFSNFTESITIGATIGERFMFLPSLGFCTILVYTLYLLVKRLNSNKAIPIIATILIPVSLVYSVKSYSRTKVWADNITLFESGKKTAPNSWRVHNNLAEAAYSRAKNISFTDSVTHSSKDSIGFWYSLAKTEFESAFDIIREQNSMPHSSLMHYGEVLFKLKDTAGAKNVFQKATTLSSNLSAAWFNLGTISFYEKDFASAVNYYQHALTANSPDFFSTNKYLGSSYLMLKDYNRSIQFYEMALKFGSDKEIVSNLSMLYAETGDVKKAGEMEAKAGVVPNEKNRVKNLMNAGIAAYGRGDYRAAVNYLSQCGLYYQNNGGFAKYPDFLNTWALSHLKLNEIGPAKVIFTKVIKENPKNYTALQNLALIAYQHEKKYAQAIEYFNRCLNSDAPDLYFTYSSLGFLYWAQNMPDKAIERFENALKYGSSKQILSNLYQLWKAKGNQEKVNYYKALLDTL